MRELLTLNPDANPNPDPNPYPKQVRELLGLLTPTRCALMPVTSGYATPDPWQGVTLILTPTVTLTPNQVRSHARGRGSRYP